MKNKEDIFVSAYLASSLWSSIDDTGNPMDESHYKWSDSAKNTLTTFALKALSEQSALFEKFVEETNTDYGQAGHTFWLSTNGHGAGFFDFDSSLAATELNLLCDKYIHCSKTAIYGGFDLFVGDDELVYC
jgi:hypothetical protein